MSNVAPLPSIDERKEKRRLHLREVTSQTVSPDTLGAMLRAARVARDEDTSEIAQKLKIRRDQVEGIEANDFSKLHGRTYAIGFVRAYARHHGLDAEEMVKRLKEAHATEDAVKPVNLVFPEALDEKNVPKGSIIVLALVIAMVIYSIVYLTIPSRKGTTSAKAETPSVIIEDPAVVLPKAEVIAPAPAQVAAAPVKTEPAAPVEAPPATTFVGGADPIPESALPKPFANFDATDAQDLALTITLAQASPFPSEQVVASAGDSRITLRALAPTYIQIRDTTLSGARGVLIGRVLNTGESFRAPDRAGLVMQTGNAGGLEVEVDGRTVGILGKSGEVITRIPVDPSYFLERMAASQ